jgi:hypothetical protein
LSFHDDRDSDRRRKSEGADDIETPQSSTSRKRKLPVPEVGQALRTVYQRAVDEDIPPEMLDLLGKLG